MKKALERTRGQFIKVQCGFKVVSDHSKQIFYLIRKKHIQCLHSANRTKTWSLTHLLPGLSVAAIADSMRYLFLHR